MMAVFFFIAHKKVLNVMRNPKLAYILVSFKGSGVTAILRLSRAGRQQQLPPAAAGGYRRH